eukprot:TRINITY_DN10042_c0_g1_i1.p1 TRINITY_DN10042_c0_g1~~TRINITY_DN10042_c0_g1_i1.p1  ORF type:complete len:401 (+),score=88.25 TRINITY_DN10042_c0_g1_i1:51-1253(+)
MGLVIHRKRRFWFRRRHFVVVGIICCILLYPIFAFLFLSRHDQDSNVQPDLRIGSYNIWNFMFHWNVRKRGIVDEIRRANPDVVGLQEIRVSASLGHQFDQLRALLPEYPYAYFENATTVGDDGTNEGVGVLSKHPIVETGHRNFALEGGSDLNRRIALYVTVNTPQIGLVNVVVTHFSYDTGNQCRNVADLMFFLNEFDRTAPLVILGDFNAYNNYPFAMLMLTGDDVAPASNPCRQQRQQAEAVAGEAMPDVGKFRDVWSSLYPHDAGLTFSNMPSPGLESRPDRILVGEHKCLREKQILVTGDGSEYRRQYYWRIVFARFWESFQLSPGLVFSALWALALIRVSRLFIVPVVLGYAYVYVPAAFDFIPEEFFPSDHRALTAVFDVLCRPGGSAAAAS